MDKPKRLRSITILCALIAIGVIFLMTTSPTNLPLPFLVLPFVWLFGVLYYASWIITGFVEVLNSKRRRMIAAGACSTLPVLLFVFGSLHQLSIRDVILSVAIVALVTFYIGRADFLR